MTLYEWLALEGNTQTKLCQLTDINPPMMSRLVSGQQSVTIETAIRLDRGTQGAIEAEHAVSDAGAALLLKYYREKNLGRTVDNKSHASAAG